MAFASLRPARGRRRFGRGVRGLVPLAPPAPTPGPNLVTGGDYSSALGWFLGNPSSSAISGGTFNAPGDAGTVTCFRAANATLVPGTYRVIFDATTDQGSIRIAVAGTQIIAGAVNGHYQADMTVAAVSNQNIQMTGASFWIGTFDNFEVRLLS